MAPAAATTTTITLITTTPITVTITTMAAAGAETGDWRELPLLVWLSPAFPVGSFAYSHGLEWAVEAGDVVDVGSLREWLADLAAFGAPRIDAALFAAAHRAAEAEDWRSLNEVNELAIALAGSAERRLETTAQGGAFRVAARAAWDCEALVRVSQRGDAIAYPIAVAAAAAGHGMARERAAQAFVVALFANLVSAAVRLGVVGQTDGQRVLAGILPDLAVMAREAAGARLDDLGACAFRSDIAAMRHETQYSRLFRS
ncbi:MAG TPA: urease accessory UreF family protein [Roseiarcus sp.]|nr:urease accessory UreF family protein [Roseiarcus sp.]